MLLFLVEHYTIKMNIIKSYNITHKYVYPLTIIFLIKCSLSSNQSFQDVIISSGTLYNQNEYY